MRGTFHYYAPIDVGEPACRCGAHDGRTFRIGVLSGCRIWWRRSCRAKRRLPRKIPGIFRFSHINAHRLDDAIAPTEVPIAINTEQTTYPQGIVISPGAITPQHKSERPNATNFWPSCAPAEGHRRRGNNLSMEKKRLAFACLRGKCLETARHQPADTNPSMEEMPIQAELLPFRPANGR